MTNRNWRRTSFRRLDGSVDSAPDDWTLLDGEGRPLARIYRYLYGPKAGCWSWFVQVTADGTPFNGGTGTALTGKEAREACEARVPVGLRERAARCEAENAGTQAGQTTAIAICADAK